MTMTMIIIVMLMSSHKNWERYILDIFCIISAEWWHFVGKEAKNRLNCVFWLNENKFYFFFEIKKTVHSEWQAYWIYNEKNQLTIWVTCAFLFVSNCGGDETWNGKKKSSLLNFILFTWKLVWSWSGGDCELLKFKVLNSILISLFNLNFLN